MDVIGLDIGTSRVKVVSLFSKGKGRFRLGKWGMGEIPKGAMASGSETSWERVATVIKKVFADIKLTERQVVVSIPECEEVYTKLMVEPNMTDSELKSAMPWEAEQYIPVPLSEVNYAYEVVKEHVEGGGMEVLLVAVNKRLVAKYERVLEMAGLTPMVLETELSALARYVGFSGKQGSILVLDIGAGLMSMGIVIQGKLVLARSILTGGEALTRALVAELAIGEDQAESFKCSYGLDRSQLEGKVAGVLLGVVKLMISEVKKTINFYQSKPGVEPVKLVVLTGGGAKMPGLVNVLAQELGLEVLLSNTPGGVEMKEEERRALEGTTQEMSVAMGLAMREV